MENQRPWHHRSEFWLTAILLAIALAHLSFLGYPLNEWDATLIVDKALHHQVTLWNRLMDPVMQPLFSCMHVNQPPQLFLIRKSIELLGPSLGSARIVPFLCGFVGFASLVFWSNKKGWSWTATIFLLMSSGTYFFYFVFHSARNDGILFAVMVLNLYGAFETRGRFLAIVSGALSGLMPLFHPAILFVWPAVFVGLLLDKDRPLGERFLKAAYWGVGFTGGMLVTLHYYDYQSIAYYFSFNRAVEPTTTTVIAKNIARLWERFFEIMSPQELISVNNHVLRLARVSLASLLLLGPHFRELTRKRQKLALITFAMWISVILLSPTKSSSYVLFVLPWTVMLLGVLVAELWAGTLTTNPVEVMFVAGLVIGLPRPLATLTILVAVVGTMRQFRKPSPTALLWWLGVALFLFDKMMEAVVILFAWLPLAIHHRPLVVGLSVLTPLIFIAGAFALESYGRWKIVSQRVLPLCLSGFWLGFVVTDLRAVVRDVHESQLSAEIERRLPDLRRERRLVGPNMLSLVEPSISLQSSDIFFFGKSHMKELKAVGPLVRYRPTRILWPVEDVGSLISQAKNFRERPLKPQEKALWKFPFGSYREIELN